jgi:hypothetical protein
MPSQSLADKQLDSFFDNLDKLNKKSSKVSKLLKTATLGHFSDAISDEDIQKSAAMVYEMLKLPKYAALRSKLSSASGVVNVVTGNEYEPLVELFIKSSFPPSANDVYNMGQDAVTPTNYFVDAKDYFAGDAQTSRGRLNNIINGTPRIMTTDWFKKETGMKDENDIKAALGEDEFRLMKGFEAKTLQLE